MDKDYMRIGEVAKLTGVPRRVLRQWEKEFPMLRPIKRKGYRLYSKRDVEIILKIKELLEKGMTPEGVKRRFEEGLSDEERGFLKILRGIKGEIKSILEMMDAFESERAEEKL